MGSRRRRRADHRMDGDRHERGAGAADARPAL